MLLFYAAKVCMLQAVGINDVLNIYFLSKVLDEGDFTVHLTALL